MQMQYIYNPYLKEIEFTWYNSPVFEMTNTPSMFGRVNQISFQIYLHLVRILIR